MAGLEFIKHLHTEKLNAQEQRAKYTFQKLAYATTLLGIGSLNIDLANVGTVGPVSAIGPIKLGFILYLVPLVALAFDLYILAEDYSVKRFGAYLGQNSPDVLEQGWEKWVSRHRDPFAPVAMPILTTVLLLAAATAAWVGNAALGPAVPVGAYQISLGFWLWTVLTGLASWALFAHYRRLRASVGPSMKPATGERPKPSDPLQRLQLAATKAGYRMDSKVYQEARRLFIASSSDPELLRSLQELAPEYGKPEFLLSVDETGAPAPPDVVKDFRATSSRHPDFHLWFQEATTEQDGEPVLLIARWLCHLVGFRHRAVHLFLDHPTEDAYLLVQVRGFDKAESPGRFDLPAAGHVVGLDVTEDTAFKELEEELGLSRDDISEFLAIGSYEFRGPMDESSFRNIEFREVYTSRLNPNALTKVKFVDHEVAGVCLFSRSEIGTLIERFPDLTASGLVGSFPIYLEHKKRRIALSEVKGA